MAPERWWSSDCRKVTIGEHIESISGHQCHEWFKFVALTRPPASFGWSNFSNSVCSSLAVTCEGMTKSYCCNEDNLMIKHISISRQAYPNPRTLCGEWCYWDLFWSFDRSVGSESPGFWSLRNAFVQTVGHASNKQFHHINFLTILGEDWGDLFAK